MKDTFMRVERKKFSISISTLEEMKLGLNIPACGTDSFKPIYFARLRSCVEPIRFDDDERDKLERPLRFMSFGIVLEIISLLFFSLKLYKQNQ